MSKRGIVVQDTQFGEGIIAVENKQYYFRQADMWKSAQEPAVTMMVDVEFNQQGEVTAIYPAKAQTFVHENAEAIPMTSTEKYRGMYKNMADYIDLKTILGMCVLVIGWFVLDTLSVVSMDQQDQLKVYSFWTLLPTLNYHGNMLNIIRQGVTGSGIYGVMGMAALCGPLIPLIWRNRFTQLFQLLPLIFMSYFCYEFFLALQHTLIDIFNSSPNKTAMDKAMMSVPWSTSFFWLMTVTAIGYGFYLSVIACLFFALKGIVQFIVYRPRR